MKTPRQALPRIEHRAGLLVVEKARIAKKGQSVVVRDSNAERVVPHALLAAVLAGPGTTLTHDAAALLADAGVVVVWIGKGGIRAYGSVQPLATQSRLLLRQVNMWASEETRTAAARRAYLMRFPGQEMGDVTVAQLRSQEGTRVRQAYRRAATEYGLHWVSRIPQWQEVDPLNQAITEATQCLYGAAAAVILGLGCSPALGLIHTGHNLSFVFDLADLHKVDVAVDEACRAIASGTSTSAAIREAMNSRMRRSRILPRMVQQVFAMLDAGAPSTDFWEKDDLRLWDDEQGTVPAGENYGGIPAPEMW